MEVFTSSIRSALRVSRFFSRKPQKKVKYVKKGSEGTRTRKVRWFKSTSSVVVDDSGKVLDAKLGLVVVFGRNVNAAFPMELVEFFQHGGVCALKTKKVKRVRANFIVLLHGRKRAQTCGKLLSSSMSASRFRGLAASVSRVCWLSW